MTSRSTEPQAARVDSTSAAPTAAARAFVALQRLVPQHGLSRLIGMLAASRRSWIRRPFIHGFARAYNVDLSEAERPGLDDYESFNDFFTRPLKPAARPLAGDASTLICPADGTVSQAGPIEQGALLQAKGHGYALEALLGGTARNFEGGLFATVYLAPHDYHRVHLPLAGRLVESRAIPGALYSVNAATEAGIPSLFARNERLVCLFDTAIGQMALVLVGAMIVASIETVWDGPPSPYRSVTVQQHDLSLNRGAEVGRFLLGSTAIVCVEPGRARLAAGIEAGAGVRMGQALFECAPRAERTA